MPYARPTLTELRAQVAADIQTELPTSDPLLRFSALKILGDTNAGLAYLQYGYTDWVSLQAIPFTATDEYLEAWASLKNVYRETAVQATGSVTFTGTSGTIPIGTTLIRGDGTQYITTAAGAIANGTVTVTAQAVADPTGLTGAFGNAATGVSMTLGTTVAGINSTGTVSTAFSGGADVETDASLRSRMLQAFQNPPQGGAQSDYVTWSYQVNGVTRAWANPNGFGPGTVVVYPMFDNTESANGGFPQGVTGCSQYENRYITQATLDLLTVADHIYPLRPVTALVIVASPIPTPINFTVKNVAVASQAAVSAAISGVLSLYGAPIGTSAGTGGEVDLKYIESAISAVIGITDFVITSPVDNIKTSVGQMPILGTVTFV